MRKYGGSQLHVCSINNSINIYQKIIKCERKVSVIMIGYN